MAPDHNADSSICTVPPEHLAYAEAQVCRWPDGNIPWAVVDELSGVRFDVLEIVLENAWGRWAKVCDIEPHYTVNARTARVLHGARRIDGPGSVLAECQLPCGGLRQVSMWFDLGERWGAPLSPRDQGIILELVATHEIGHALGLGHAPAGSANIMAPAYNPKQLTFGEWDIYEARDRRYGAPSGRRGTPPYPATPIPPPSIPIPPPVVPPLPPPPAAPGGTMTRDELRATLERFMRAASWLATFTRTQADDQVVAFVQEAIKHDWLLDILLSFLNGNRRLTVDEALIAIALAKPRT